MRKCLLIFILLSIYLILPSLTFAQSMMGGSTETTTDGHTAREEAQGKEVWEKLQAKQVECINLTNDNFETLGEYFMGLRLGSSHENMNNMMKNMMGEAGEIQMHISLGKRQSGCDGSYPFPTQGFKFLPMMGMMNYVNNQNPSGISLPINDNNIGSMMAGWNSPSGLYGSIIWILVIIFLVLGIIYFWKEINKRK